MKKKILAMIIIIALLICIFAFVAFNGNSEIFKTKDKGATITSVTKYGKTLSKIEIPSSVTSIGERAFNKCSSLTSIVIPSSVTSIGEYAFSGCSSLEEVYYKGDLADWCGISFGSSGANPMCYASKLYINGELLSGEITIPSSVTSIGSYAFDGCRSLTSIEIPSSVTSIGKYAFQYCSSLTIYCEVSSKPSGWDYYWNSSNRPVVWNCKNNEVADDGYIYFLAESGIKYGVKNGEAKIAGHSAISGDRVIPSIVTYKGNTYTVTSIGEDAFYDCSSLTSIKIPSSVTSIGSYAFYYCSKLTSIEIPSSVTSIGSSAFYYCSKLTSIEIPSSVTSIGSFAFRYCTSLTSIKIPSSVTSMGSDAFEYCSSLTIYCEAASQPSGWYSGWNFLYTLPGGTYCDCPVVWKCKNNGIANDGNIYYVANNGIRYAIKGGEATIVRQSSTISGAKVIPTSITYNGNSYTVTSIDSEAFYECSALTSVTFGENSKLKNIGEKAFSYCSSLTRIEIPSSVTSIGESALFGSSSLTIYCERASKPSGWDSWWNDNKSPVVWNYKNNDIATDGNIYYVADNGIRYALKNGKATVVRQSEALSGAKVIPSSVTYKGNTYTVTNIGEYAFSNCSTLTSIEIPSSVTSIGSRAFYNCRSLTSIEIPSSVTSIGNGAFDNCSSLTSIEIPSSVTSIGSWAFSGCSSLTSIEIPSSVTRIGLSAFYKCTSLTSIEIPSSVISIGECAFQYCSSLTIYCEVSSKPSGWDSDWNYSNRPVVWNYKNN